MSIDVSSNEPGYNGIIIDTSNGLFNGLDYANHTLARTVNTHLTFAMRFVIRARVLIAPLMHPKCSANDRVTKAEVVAHAIESDRIHHC